MNMTQTPSYLGISGTKYQNGLKFCIALLTGKGKAITLISRLVVVLLSESSIIYRLDTET